MSSTLDKTQPHQNSAGLKHNLRGVYRFLDYRIRTMRTPALWDMKMIEDMDVLAKILPTLKPGNRYKVRGFDGKEKTFKIPDFDRTREYLDIYIVSYRDLSQNIDRNGVFISKNSFRLVPYYVLSFEKSRHVIEKQCIPQVNKDIWGSWKRRWEGNEPVKKDQKDQKDWSYYRHQLEGLIEKHWDRLRNVDQILCVALGALESDIRVNSALVRDYPRNYVQHLAASTIRDKLHQLASRENILKPAGYVGKGKKPVYEQSTSPSRVKKIPIIAQDPAYCGNCKKVLKEKLDINATSFADGFKNITKNTFIICIAPAFDLVGIICDLTCEFGGPVGMLCNEIELDTRRWDGRKSVDPWLKWDEWDGHTRSIDRESGNLADRATRNMVQYAMRCRHEDFGDHKDLTGITLRERLSKFHDLPVQAVIRRNRKEFPDGEEGDRLYKAKYKWDYKTHLEKSWGVNAPKGGSPNFGDLKLYVRND